MHEKVNNQQSKSNLVCRGLIPGEKAAYLEFAQQVWGRGSRQADATRLVWLHEENPNSGGMERDLLILQDGSHIVGAHHKMRIPWNIRDQRVSVPSLHDLAVLPTHRTGGGLQLILAALAREPHAVLFGLSKTVDRIYDRMRVPQVSMFWLYKVRSGLRTAFQMVGRNLAFPAPTFRRIAQRMTLREGYQITRMINPSSDELAEALVIKPHAEAYPDWDMAAFRWRFFHPLGPKNILFVARKNGAPAGRAVISVGIRHGVLTGKILELVFQDSESLHALGPDIETTFDEMKIPLSLAVTASPAVAEHLKSTGWRFRKKPSGARWFTQKKSDLPTEFWVSGGVWDFGFDTGCENVDEAHRGD